MIHVHFGESDLLHALMLDEPVGIGLAQSFSAISNGESDLLHALMLDEPVGLGLAQSVSAISNAFCVSCFYLILAKSEDLMIAG